MRETRAQPGAGQQEEALRMKLWRARKPGTGLRSRAAALAAQGAAGEGSRLVARVLTRKPVRRQAASGRSYYTLAAGEEEKGLQRSKRPRLRLSDL
jgi:hypothetical protein